MTGNEIIINLDIDDDDDNNGAYVPLSFWDLDEISLQQILDNATAQIETENT